MPEIAQERRTGGAGMFSLSLLMIVPSVLSFLASSAIAHGVDFPASALWFVYEVSWWIGILGAAIVIGMTLMAAFLRTASVFFVTLMAIASLAAIMFIWCAAHIYRSPW